MSRIHEALKKAAEERSSRLATEGSPNFADVAGDVTRSSLADQQLTRPQLHTELRKSADPGRLQFEDLIKKCAHPKWKIDPRSSVFHGAGDHNVGAERFRTLRSRLYQIAGVQPLKKILVTSSLPAEGKTFVASNLANSIIRQNDRRVLLIDADLRASRLHQTLGAPIGPGLSDYLRGDADEFAVIQNGLDNNLCFIAGGSSVSNPSELLLGERMKRLLDLGALRIKEMDEAGIDIQVLSHGAPAAQKIPADVAVPLTRKVNDRLHEAIAAYPTRLAAFASLPTDDPAAAADELERCVTKLGFKGAMLHGMAHGKFLDDKRFWPIYARAEKLDVPIYLHPSLPNAAVTDAYYADYIKEFPMVVRPAWGYTVETATTAIRMVLSGVFDAHPRLKVILGHLGETLPFLVWRIDHALARPGQKALSFRDVFCGNFYITTSGNFSNPALLCSVMEMGIDRVLFAVDWPFVDNMPATQWIDTVPLCDEDKVKLLSGNARRILHM